jgi:hypothetical protein
MALASYAAVLTDHRTAAALALASLAAVLADGRAAAGSADAPHAVVRADTRAPKVFFTLSMCFSLVNVICRLSALLLTAI